MFVFFIVAVAGFPFAFSQIDLGTAYAVWAGIGTVSTALIGIFWFSEKATPLKICGIILIITGVIMLNISEAKVGNNDTVTEASAITESMDGTSGGAV